MIEPLILVRSLHFAASLLAAGTVSFLVLVAEPVLRPSKDAARLGALRRRYDRLTWSALTVAVLSGAAWLRLLANQILGPSVPNAGLHGAWIVLIDTRFGSIWWLRLLLALALAGLIALPAMRWLQLAAAVAFVALLALVGHAGATPGASGEAHLAVDMVHLVAAAIWLGALPALALLLRAGLRDQATRMSVPGAVSRFSMLGIGCVAALLATGLVNSWMLLAGVGDLVASAYGRLLALKIALFAAMVGIAAINRLRLTPRLPAISALRALMRNSMAETLLGLGVVIAVAALGTLEPGSHAAHETGTAIPEGAAFTHIHMPEVMADVTIDPGHVGYARAILRVMREDGSLFPTKYVALALDPPHATRLTPARGATQQADGTWRVDGLDLVQSGIWTVRVLVATGAKTPVMLDAPIVIESNTAK